MMKYNTFIGIDVSKKTFDAAVIKDGKEYYQKFNNDLKGIKSLLNWVKKSSNSKEPDMIFCMEHMGLYTVHLSCFLSDNNISYCLENPLQIKLTMGITRMKNDKADAKVIAKYILLHHPNVSLYKIPNDNIIKLKNLLAHRERLIKSKMIFIGSIKELPNYTSKDVHHTIIKDSKQLQKSMDKMIKNIDADINMLIMQDEDLSKNYQLAKSVPGVGANTAAYMLVYTNNFQSFDNWRQFACFSGIAPFEHTSGTSVKGKTQISHLANKKMKALLSMGALAAIKSDKELKSYYTKKVEEGKHKMSVQNVIRNKLIGRVFAAVKRGTPYVNIMNFS